MVGLEFPEISPVLFAIGPLAIRWYSLAYLVGIIFGWFVVNKNIKKYDIRINKDQLEDLCFYIVIGIILGGRLGYVLFYGGENNPYFKNPLKIFEIWQGGMSFHGGIGGVILAMYYCSIRFNVPFLKIADLVALPAPLGLFLGRLANFVNDELWGRVTDVSWAVRFPSGGYLPRHPSQLYEAILEGLVIFVVVNLLWRNKWIRERTGFVASVFAIMYSLSRIFVEMFREPDEQVGFLFRYFTMGQLLSLPLMFAGIWVICKHTVLKKKQ